MTTRMNPDATLTALVDAAVAGDRKAQDVIIRKFEPDVRRRVHRWLSEKFRTTHRWIVAAFSTGDIVQAAFRDLIRNLESVEVRSREDFAKYLSVIAYRQILGHLAYFTADKRDARRQADVPTAGMDAYSGGPRPERDASAREQLRRFRTALETLPKRQRTLIELRVVDEEPYGTIAERLGYKSADTARHAYYAAKTKLLLLLGENARRHVRE